MASLTQQRAEIRTMFLGTRQHLAQQHAAYAEIMILVDEVYRLYEDKKLNVFECRQVNDQISLWQSQLQTGIKAAQLIIQEVNDQRAMFMKKSNR